MSNIKAQQSIIESTESIKYTTGALRDISAIELQQLREEYKKNDLFYSELQDLYQIVWKIADAQNRLDFIDKRKHRSTLYVAYTTNRHFYGVLNHDVMRAFFAETDENSKCLIIGETGKEIWKNSGKKSSFIDFLSFIGDTPNKEERQTFLNTSVNYDSVIVFYPRFVSVYKQRADSLDVTFRPAESKLSDKIKEELPKYLLEPNIEQMIAFFNTQVRYMLFERMLLESELSRVAARLVRMDSAEHNATDMLKIEHRELRRIERSFSSSRMLETMVGYIQWHKTTM